MISPSSDKTVAYGHPLIPPEWIAACGLRPRWIEPWRVGAAAAGLRRGVCPFAAAAAEADFAADAAVVWATSCDQMRYAAELVQGQPGFPFVFNVPHTWQTPAARRLYRDELLRLAAFLTRCGGHDYTPDALRQCMLRYETARAEVRAEILRYAGCPDRVDTQEFADTQEDRHSCLSGAGAGSARAQGADSAADRQECLSSCVDAARAVIAVRGDLASCAAGSLEAVPRGGPHCLQASSGTRPESSRTAQSHPGRGARLALVGGPLAPEHPLRTAIEVRGGRVVLDATEGGERTLPAAFDADKLESDPLDALVAAYFDGFADPLRRPDDAFYRWLGEAIVARRVDALVLHRYLWCDTWHGLLGRLRQWSPVPVLDCESVDTLGELDGRRLGRLEAFLETLA